MLSAKFLKLAFSFLFFKEYYQNSKQFGSWWGATFCGVSSGSKPFAKAFKIRFQCSKGYVSSQISLCSLWYNIFCLRWIFIKRTSLNEIFHKSVVLFLISLCGRHRLLWDETLFKCIRPSFPNTRLNLNNQWGKCPFIDAYCCVRTNEWFQDNNCESYLFTLNNPGER